MKRLAPKPSLIAERLVREYKLDPGDMTQRLTSASDLFVLAHMSVPHVTVEDWRLDVTGLVDQSISITFEELRSLPKRTLESFHQCAGSLLKPTIPTRRTKSHPCVARASRRN